MSEAENKKIIELSDCKVELKPFLTWGDVQDIDEAVAGGVKLNGGGKDLSFDASAVTAMKYKLLEVSIVKVIPNKEGEKEFSFSKDWVRALSVEDGEKLYEAVEGLNPKKK